MKKLYSVLSFALVIIMLCAFVTTVSAKDISSENSNSTTINTPYDYPVKPGTQEWKNMIKKEDRLKACQIPENILKNMSTPALIETVLNYPFISDYFAFNKYEDAAKTFYNDFNGFRELYSRSNLTMDLLEEYKNSYVATNTTLKNYTSSNTSIYSTTTNFFKVSNIEFLISYDQLLNKDYTTKEANLFDNELKEKMEERKNASIYSPSSEIYLNFMSQSSPVKTATTNATVKTPKGTSVQVMSITPDLSASEKQQINNYYDSRYPNAVRKASATKNYNCHSYAWYSQSTSNKYWMNDPKAYMTDGSYKLSKDVRQRIGFKAYYYNGDHSAVVQDIKVVGGSQVFYYQSKWGQAGLYYHTIYDCPYSTGVRHYYIAS